MELTFSAEIEAFRAEVRNFVQENLPDGIRRKVAAEKMELPREDVIRWHKILAEKGWACPAWPEEYGGTGWSDEKSYVFEREIALCDAPRPLTFGVGMLAPTIMEFGTKEQKKRFLPPIANGDVLWCQGFSEPNAGSDLASLQCKAERDGDDYVINGSKTWTTDGHISDWIFGLYRTDNSGRKQQGISVLLIDLDSPGISMTPILTFDGTHEINQVFFDNVRVPVANRLGEENQGWGIGKYMLGLERFGTAEVSRSFASLDRLKRLADSTVLNGVPLSDTPAFSEKISQVEIELRALEVTEQRFLFQPGGADAMGAEACMLKVRGTEIQQRIFELTVEALGHDAHIALPDDVLDPGGADLSQLAPVESGHATRAYFNFRKTSIYSGSNEIQKNIIAKAVLGLLTMDFSLNDEQVLMRDTVSRFLSDNFTFEKRQAIVSEGLGYKEEHWDALAELGILALPFGEDSGGLDGGAVDSMVVMEQMGRALLTGPYVATVLLAGKLLEQADEKGTNISVLEGIISGQRKMSFAYAERNAGHDVSGTALRAIPNDDGYRLTGEKCAVFHADSADEMVVLARTSGKPGDKAGLSLFLVPSAIDGMTVSTYATQDGNRAADICFDEVEVLPSCLIGKEDRAFDIVERILDHAAAAVVAEAVGIMWAVYEMTLEYMKTRTQFGATLGSFQALQHRMVDMYMMCEMAQSMACDAAVACDSGSDADRRKAVSAAKSLVGRYGRKVGQEGIQLHGAIGMTMEVAVGHYFKRLCMIDASFGDVAWHEARHACLER